MVDDNGGDDIAAGGDGGDCGDELVMGVVIMVVI